MHASPNQFRVRIIVIMRGGKQFIGQILKIFFKNKPFDLFFLEQDY